MKMLREVEYLGVMRGSEVSVYGVIECKKESLLLREEAVNEMMVVMLSEVYLDDERVLARLSKVLEAYSKLSPAPCFVLMGEFMSPSYSVSMDGVRDLFSRLGSVIGLYPRLVREGNREVVTLGVGDGANDVEMIRAAHIGVGIIGKEGTQAVNNADYAISQFRYLTRLILVYGHHEYRGITLAALLIFYKNILFTLIQYLYTFVCGLSGTRNQSYAAIFWYNTALTAFGPLLLAVFDKDVTDANCYKFPQLHRQGIEHRLFSVKRFLVYMAKAVYEAVAIGLVVNLTMSRCDFPTGTLDVWLYGTIAVTINIFVANVSPNIEQSPMMGITVFFFWGTFFFWLLLVLFNSLSLDLFPDYFGSFSLLFSRPVFYLVFLLATVLSILPTMMLKALQREWALFTVRARGEDEG